MKIKINELLLSLTCLSLSFSVFASTTHVKSPPRSNKTHSNYKGEVAPVSVNHFELIAAGGVGAANVANSYLQVTSSETDTLKQTNSSQWNDPIGQLGAGYLFYLRGGPRISNDWRWFPIIEPMLNVYYSQLNVKGDVYRFEDPAFNEFSYNSVIQSTRLMLEAALTIVSKKQFSLYALAGIGESWNRISYNDQGATSPCPITAVDLDKRNQSNFAWDLGAGVAYAFNPIVSLSLEYLYTNLGTLDLSSSSGDTGNITAPQLGGASANVYTQSVLLGLHVALG